jgi:hypothetical protein
MDVHQPHAPVLAGLQLNGTRALRRDDDDLGYGEGQKA